MIRPGIMRRLVACAAIVGLLPAVCTAQADWATPCEVSDTYLEDNYQNAFTLTGIGTSAQVESKVQSAFNQLFVSGSTSDQRILFETTDGMSFIEAIDSDDIRSEGISYGMMVAVQLDQQAMFDKLWNFALTRMLQRQGTTPRWFAWRVSTTSPYSALDTNPAPDGEVYMATALIFAHNRWGSGSYSSTDTAYGNYRYWATEVIRMIRSNLWDSGSNLILFSPATSNKYTDPSYNIPVFYDLFSVWENKFAPTDFWRKAATSSRALLVNATSRHPATYLSSDYTHFDGSPVSTADSGTSNANSANFAYDSWRVIQNIWMDTRWCTRDSHFAYHGIHQLNFFNNQGGANARAYKEIYNPATGAALSEYRSEGLVAMNAVGSLLNLQSDGDGDIARAFLTDLWNQNPPVGTYRYYAGMLHMLALLHTSGKYRMHKAGGAAPKILSGTTLDASSTSTTQVQPRVIVKNNSGATLTNFKAHYFFTAEDGKTPVLTDVSTPNSTVTLQQLDTRSWAVVLDYSGKTLKAGQSIPSSGAGETFSVKYSDNSKFDKSNDYSQPRNGSSYTGTDRVAVYDGAGVLKMGSIPNGKLPSYPGTLKSTWSSKLVTATGTQNDAETRAQPLNSSWTSQTWQVEPVPSTGYVRLKNAWNGSYLNVQSQAENAKIVTYQLNIPWTSQLWSVENISGSTGVRLKNAWSGKYLTVTDTGNYAEILSKSLNTGWASQVWSIQ